MSTLYADLAAWWPLFSPPEDYADEAADIQEKLTTALGHAPATLLELGSGGGNIASYLRDWTTLTLTDLSADMLAVSAKLNPGVEHIQGDLRSLRLSRRFEAVLVHDAIMYMTTPDDLLAGLETARAHLAPGGAVLVLPDYTTETYITAAEMGGDDAKDGSGRAVRWLEWQQPLTPGSDEVYVDYSLVLREPDGSVRSVLDRHRNGVFSRERWRDTFRRAGFPSLTVLSDPWREDIFLAR